MNISNNMASQNIDLHEFLSKHISSGGIITHTRIKNEGLNIRGGAYIIPREELSRFHELYYDNIFNNKKKEYLTEKQIENGPLVVDFDFRYNYDVDTRQHTAEHIQDMIMLYLEELKSCFVFEENKLFDIFIFEKKNVNRLEDKSLTKDGIHMLIGIQVDHTMQLLIRDRILLKLADIWDLPLLNDWDSVLDEGISKGTTNWQLYGSRKPGNEPYELVEYYKINYDKTDGEFMMTQKKVTDFDIKNNFTKLSVQYDGNPVYEKNPLILDKYNKSLESKHRKIKRPQSKTKLNLLIEDDDCESIERISLHDIVNNEVLERAVNIMLNSFTSTEYEYKELHYYTQILPEKYYEPGSHLLNRQVAFALKHAAGDRLFLSWIMLRSKASDFSYSEIPDLYTKWKRYFNNYKEGGITRRSIMYWAKQDAYEEYEKVKNITIDVFYEKTLSGQTEWDLAYVLRQMFKDKYVCVSYANKGGIWYMFKNHRWEMDTGISLRLAMSKNLYTFYENKRNIIDVEFHELNTEQTTGDRCELLKEQMKIISSIMVKLKKTTDKNNILREAMELFFDKEFIKNMDTNPNLLCFNNGVVDFKNKIFRDGYPQDYITKTTGIDYNEFNTDNSEMKRTSEDILSFMEKLFPIPELNRYMWDHLSSCLIGVNRNQTFNIYFGSGSNGKSMLTDLMSATLGEYKGTVPVTLVTRDRNTIGGTSSEVAQLKGIRYAAMQEPSKGAKLNEGVMKELTGGDPIQARALYAASETFVPQFNLIVCLNNLFDIESNDDGTWRRVRRVDFLSKFVDNCEEYTDDTKFVFPKDKSLKEKLPIFAPVFASMLVKRAFETNGIVEDCEIVLTASNSYRKGQDLIASFVNETIVKTRVLTDKVGKAGLSEAFKLWYQREQGGRKIPKAQELYDYMDKKFGQHTGKGWVGVKEVVPEYNDIEELEE